MVEFKSSSPMDREKFLVQFEGAEDVAQYAVETFLKCVHKYVEAVNTAIQNKSPADLEMAAHTLRGALSNFFAEPSMLLAWELEQFGHRKVLDEAGNTFEKLKAEVDRLIIELTKMKNGKFAA